MSGTGPLRWKKGVSGTWIKEFYEDLRGLVADHSERHPYLVTWESVELTGCKDILDDVAALRKAGVPMWAELTPET